MNKRLRNDDLEYTTNDNILNMLYRTPLFYRSLQVVYYLETNPLIFTGFFVPINVFQCIHDYIINMFTLFFHESNLYYYKGDTTISNEKLEIYINSTMSANDVSLNFSFLMSNLYIKIKTFLKGSNLKVNYIACDGEVLRIECRLGEGYYELDNDNDYPTNSDAIFI